MIRKIRLFFRELYGKTPGKNLHKKGHSMYMGMCYNISVDNRP